MNLRIAILIGGALLIAVLLTRPNAAIRLPIGAIPSAVLPTLAQSVAGSRESDALSERPAGSGAGAGPRPVGEEFAYAQDYYAFMRDHAVAAYGGDARASHFLWQATLACQAALGLAKIDHSTQTEDYPKCQRLETEADPFAELPPRDGGYSWQYWKARALADGDALAHLTVAVSADAAPKAVQAALEAAAASGEPEVYYSLGLALMSPSLSQDVTEALSWQLVACERGYDCRVDNPRVGGPCLNFGTCTPGQTVIERVREADGTDALIFTAQARAAEILAALDRGETPEVRR